jgi:alpha-L-rhamnosidase
MYNHRKKTSLKILITAAILLSGFILANAASAVVIENLQVEYTKTPLGIDVKQPRFSWQMNAPEGKRNYSQTAFQIVVKDPKGIIVWDTKKVNSDKSVGIVYAGTPLGATTRYTWTVSVWDQTGSISTTSSWFETGLMNPDPKLSAWDGATWIGGSEKDMVLYSHYLPIFTLKYSVSIAEGSTKAGFILGANDSRLMDKNKNLFQLQNGKNQSYLKLELDISAVDDSETGKAELNVYRAGYTDKDVATVPVKTFEIKNEFINKDNKNKEHRFLIKDIFGELAIIMDDSDSFFVPDPNAGTGFQGFGEQRKGAIVNLNPMGKGGDVITYGQLCDMGFSLDAGQKAVFTNVSVSNSRAPETVLFSEDLTKPVYDGIFTSYVSDATSGIAIKNSAYQVSGGEKGIMMVADPSHNAMPMFRTKFAVSNKKIESARLYVTSRGIYEVYLNGKRVGDDYYNPGLTQYNITHLYQTYDVTNMVSSGQNALGAMLGEGWWSGLLSFGTIWNHFGDRQSLLAKIVILY